MSASSSIPAPPQRIEFPEHLPVSARREDIAAALSAHQVVIVCGETGSGKTTQLPKIAYAAGRGRQGLIGMTQPRRIAAKSVAQRIAELRSLEADTLVSATHDNFQRLFNPSAQGPDTIA